MTYSPMLLPGDGGGNPFSCMDDYCGESDLVWGSGGSIMDFWYEDGASGGTPNTPDFQYFTRWREDQCAAAADDRVDSLEAVGLMVLACATVETGVGALACAAAGGGVIKTMNRGGTDSKHCLEAYPGPGNWQ